MWWPIIGQVLVVLGIALATVYVISGLGGHDE